MRIIYQVNFNIYKLLLSLSQAMDLVSPALVNHHQPLSFDIIIRFERSGKFAVAAVPRPGPIFALIGPGRPFGQRLGQSARSTLRPGPRVRQRPAGPVPGRA